MTENLVTRLRKRAEIRRQIPTRKSVQEGKPDKIADLLEEAADEIEDLKRFMNQGWSHAQCPSCGQEFLSEIYEVKQLDKPVPPPGRFTKY